MVGLFVFALGQYGITDVAGDTMPEFAAPVETLNTPVG